MPTKLNLCLSIASNSPGTPTGYGQQVQQLVERLNRSGVKVASLSNFGLEGMKSEMKIAGHKVAHYPKGVTPYSADVIAPYHKEFSDQYPDRANALLTLYDVWVYNDLRFDGEILAWTPLDHITLPPKVALFLKRENVTPVTMSPHGQSQLAAAGIDSVYIPHAVDSKIMKPTYSVNGVTAREYMGVRDDQFLVGMVAANKANGVVHRKAMAENLLAFSIFLKEYPDAVLYIHTEPSAVYGGFNLPLLLKACGVPEQSVIFPDQTRLRSGYSQQEMAAFYSAFDVLLSTSYGEGFGIPTIEAQMCGTRVITSGFAASADLASEDSWLVSGQPFWDESQQSFFSVPNIPEIVEALRQAEKMRGESSAAREFALQFDADTVFETYWLPFLRDKFTPPVE